MKKATTYDPKAVSEVANILKISKTTLLLVLNNFNSHYHSKKTISDSGKVRTFYCPDAFLLKIQRAINKHILNKAKLSEYMHGYRKKRSALSNAECHIGKKVVAKYDIKNFFPSISYHRVLKVFSNLGLNASESKILMRLTTADHHLPHGFATSPMIANLSLQNLSSRLGGAFKKYNLDLSFYSDDVTVSGNYDIQHLERLIIKIFKQEGFEVNKEKTSYLSHKEKQEITGYTVNKKVNLPRKIRDDVKAVINNCLKNGASSQLDRYWRIFGDSKKGKKNPHKLRQRLNGKINALKKTAPNLYDRLRNELQRIDWSS